MESGLRAATAQRENRQWRFGLWLLSLPEGDQARGVVGAATGIGRRLKNALAYGGKTEKTVLLEELETCNAELLQEKEAEAKAAAGRTRPGLTMFTDGSRLDGGATGYSLVWKKGQTWAGVKVHMGNNQEAYNAECAALACALELASRRNKIPERVTIFSDAQAPSDGWHRTNLAPGSSTPSSHGNTSPHCASPGRGSSSKCDGARRPRESQATRRPMSGQR